jgi:CubicO group peptidase (beta-lactamase class C family)
MFRRRLPLGGVSSQSSLNNSVVTKRVKCMSVRVLKMMVVALALVAARENVPAQAGQAATGSKGQAARFADSERRPKLSTAFADVDALFSDFATQAHVPGAAWGIVIDGELAHSGSMGTRETASKAPVDADTVFRIASMTKSFTAMAILSLRDAGKLSLDEPAERYVPELTALTYPTSDSPRITIRHLLSHSAGFPEDNPWGDQQLRVSAVDMRRMIRGGIPFSNAPGLTYEYSNYGFAILGAIVARVSGRSYNDYVTANILRPLGMTSTTFEPAKVDAGRLAHGYRWQDERWSEEPLLADGAFGAMGGMLTSVRDLSRYVGALLNAWPPRDDPESGPIRRSSLREMQQMARFAGATSGRDASGATQMTASGYGYGLRVFQTCTFRHAVAHGGGLPGFGSIMQWLPEYGVGIIAFGNLTYTGWARVTADALARLDKTGGLQPRVVQPSPSLVDAQRSVTHLIARWDDRLAASLAAENLFLDLSAERRKAQLEALREKYGACSPEAGPFDVVENALRGQWIVGCERGKLRASITLAPTMPPKVQFLSVRPVDPVEMPTGACVQ